MKFKEGQLVWCSLHGPMRIEVLPNPPKQTTVQLRTPYDTIFWAGLGDLVPLLPSTMDTYLENYEARFPPNLVLRQWQKELSPSTKEGE